MLENWFWNRAKSLANTSGRIPNYEIQPDGTIQVNFVDPSETDKKAYDTSISPKQQITLKGYANAIELNPENAGNGEVDLVPTERYRQFMEQNILSQAMSAGGMNDQKLMYLTMANLATLLLFGIIGMAVLF